MPKTKNYYTQNHEKLIAQYNSAKLPKLHALFEKHIKKDDRVLDIGFGSGRDLRFIQTLNAIGYGVDPCSKFVEKLQGNSSFKERVFVGELPNLRLPINFKFDVITIVAVLMHLQKEQLPKAIESIKHYLLKGGKVIVSYSTTPRKNDERFFEDLRDETMKNSFLEAGFRLIEESFSYDGLEREIEWRSEVYEL